MKTTAWILVLLALLCPALSPAAAMQDRVNGLLVKRLLGDVTGDVGRASLKGDKSLWVAVMVQTGISAAPGMASLERDLRQTDLEGTLRDAGFKVMDPKRRSLGLGLRPTLALAVLYEAAGPGPDAPAFYLVLGSVTQQCTPLGGEEMVLTTWAQAGEPILAKGDASDVDAIRAAAQARVQAFIEATKP